MCEGIYVLGNGNWEDPADRGSVESGQWPLCDVMGWDAWEKLWHSISKLCRLLARTHDYSNVVPCQL